MATQEQSQWKGRDLAPILPKPFTYENAAIETERLILRPILESDAEAFFAIRSCPKVVQWSKTRQTDPDVEASLNYIKGRYTNPDVFGRGYSYAITRRDDPTDRLIGGIGVNDHDPRSTGSYIGYVLHPDYWGKGYATEALKGMLKGWWSLPRREVAEGEFKEEIDDDEALRWKRREEDGDEYLLGMANKANGASLKVMLKSGFEVLEEFQVEDGSTLVRTMIKKPASGE
ncbi:hypothetical protein FQN54_003445 [Arachnomyces sp. PD_36]|nr:hypothetical protein FQN54_003445 [Arachnomyces sp. PD_36]